MQFVWFVLLMPLAEPIIWLYVALAFIVGYWVGRRRKRPRAKNWLLLLALPLIAGCSPLSSDATKALFESMQERSACVMIGGGAASAALVPGPGIPIGGGYGYAWILRVMPEHAGSMDANGCTITVNQ